MVLESFRALIVAGFVFMSATSSAARDSELRMTLTIDNREVGKVLTGREVRQALSTCNPPKSCKYVGLQREPQIYYAAQYEQGGYSIGHRSGPPGPLWNAARRGEGKPDRFSTSEMIALTADYLDSKDTSFVRWNSKDLNSE